MVGVKMPLGTVTFLFSDIVGSTALWERAGREMSSAVARHDELVHAAVGSHHGYVFTTAGDSFAVSFSRVTDAVAAAAEIRDRIRAERWPAGTPIVLRIGLHTGEAEERGGDYFGPAVNRAARIMAVAHPGQVLLSSTTARMAIGTETLSIGTLRLRGLVDTEEISQLGTEQFPPISVELSGNLPAAETTFVGREADLEAVKERVGHNRLVTLVGPGGIGKTRLALEAGSQLSHSFEQGVWFIDLTTTGKGPGSIAEAIGRVMGFDARGEQGWLSTVVSTLSVRESLLVLDNCEHVLADAAAVTDAIIRGGSSVTVLATSREALGLQLEQVWRVASLDDGPRLFADRARSVAPGFDPAASSAAIQAICDRLDGLPLAIELAASRVGSMQPEEIAARLDERFRLLRSRDQTVDPRHRTLDATVRWSDDLLTAREREMFCQLGVFVGSFDTRSAAALCGPHLDEVETIDLLDGLVAKSLVVAFRHGATTRYRLLETMSAYARTQLADDFPIDTVQTKHALVRAKQTIDDLDRLANGRGDRNTLSALHADLADLDATFELLAVESPDLAAQVMAAMVPFSVFGTLGGSRLGRIGATLYQQYQRGNSTALAAVHGASAQFFVGNSRHAIAMTDELAASRRLDPTTEAAAANLSGWIALQLRGDRDRVATEATRALELVPLILNVSDRVVTRALALTLLADSRGFESASRYLEQPGYQEPPAGGYLAMNDLLATAFVLRGIDIAQSSARLRDALQFAEGHGDTQAVAWLGYNLAINKLAARDSEGAISDLISILGDLLDRGDPFAFTYALDDLAAALAYTGRPGGAALLFATADAERTRNQWTALQAYATKRQRLLPRLQDALGPDRYGALWAEGQSLSLDQATQRAPDLVSSDLW